MSFARYGARIEAGLDMAEHSQSSLAWAAAYDTAAPEQPSLAVHEAWLARQNCRVLRLDSAPPVAELLKSVLAQLA